MAEKDSVITGSDPPAVMIAELRAVGFEDAQVIGRGGFGVVYRCREKALGRIVAVKVLTSVSDYGGENLARFLREQRAMGGLPEHPNIVQILQVGTTGHGHPFLVVPYYARGSLEQRIRQSGPLSVAQSLRVAVKLAGALETVHRAGILHRDIKPGNVLLTDYGEPQLTDFGIARMEGGFATTTGVVTGSPAFTAPEVLRDGTPSVVSDVYGLGATLFCMLTGHAAYQRHSGERLVAQFLRIAEEPVPDLRPTGMPGDICELIEASMSADSATRPESALAFGNRVRQLQRNHDLPVDEMAIPQLGPAITLEGAADTGRATVSAPFARTGTSVTPPTAETRFYPARSPRRLVARPRLLEVLDADPWPRLIVVHAPAGFGKSTLAAQWGQRLIEREVAACWLNIDDDDNNPAWFLLHLIEAVRHARPALAADLDRIVEEHGAGVARYVLTTLINRIHAGGERLVVFIEDWHLVTDADTTAALRLLLDNGCHHLQLLVTSREMIGLPLSALRVRDELIEIDSTALRFDDAEAAEFLSRVNGLTLGDRDVGRLCSGTDGWIAGLQLASISLRGKRDPAAAISAISGRHQAIGEYLTDNVLDALAPELLTSLLETAVTERICGPLASALTGRPDGQAMLEDIERRDLFLRRIDEGGRWFRYHHLFSDFLQQRLERDRPERIPELHSRAAHWFADNNMLSEAVDHALAAGEPKLAVRLVSEHARDAIQHSQLTTLTALADKLPPTQANADTDLQLALAWAAVLLRRPHRMHIAVELAIAGASANDEMPQRDSNLVVEANLVRCVASALSDHLEGVDAIVAQCCARTDTLDPFVLCAAADLGAFAALHRFDYDRVHEWHRWGRTYFQHVAGALSVMYNHCFAGMAAREQLDTATAEDHFRTALQVARTTAGENSLTVRLASAILGDFHYEQGDFDEAERLLEASIEVGFEGGTVDFLLSAYGTSARIAAARGDRTKARERLAEGAEVAETHGLPRLAARITLEHARLGAAVLPAEIPGAPGDDGIAIVTRELLEEAAIRTLLLGDQAGATARAAALRQSIDGEARPRAALYSAVLYAHCLLATGQRDAAEPLLAGALRRCAQANIVAPLFDEGPDVLSEIRRLTVEFTRDRHAPNSFSLPRAFLDRLARPL